MIKKQQQAGIRNEHRGSEHCSNLLNNQLCDGFETGVHFKYRPEHQQRPDARWIFSVLADYELSMIRERTRAGLRAARARGSQVGKVKLYFDKDKATQLRDQGWGQIKIARELGIGVGRVNQWVRDEYIPQHLRKPE